MTSPVATDALARHVRRYSRELIRARRGASRGVHQARVASRRLREGLGALDEALAPDVHRRVRRMLRRMSRILGALRECDVTLALITEESARHGWPVASAGIITADVEVARARHHRALVKILADSRWKDAVAHMRHQVNVTNHDAIRAAARARRIKRARDLGRAVATVGALYVPDQLHAFRIATKKLRYALEWDHEMGGKGWMRERQVLQAAQETLGQWHDRLVLQTRIHHLRRSGEYPRMVIGDFKRMAADLERECRAAHARMLRSVPAILRVTTAGQR